MESETLLVALDRQRRQVINLRDTLAEYGRRLNASHHMAAMQRVEIERLQSLLRRLLDDWHPSDSERMEILRSFNSITQGAT